MTCDDCRRRLQARLDGEAVPADEMVAHLAACPACRGLEAAARRLQTGLRLLTPPAPPPDIAGRLATAVLADQRRRRVRRRLAFAGCVSAAAASLLLALTALSPRQSSPGWLEQKVAAVRNYFFPPTYLYTPSNGFISDLETWPADWSPTPSLNDDMAEATSAVASLARRTADETVSNGQVLVPSLSVPMPGGEALAPPAESLREAGNGVVAGLEPVANSARRALDLFLRDIPPVAPQ